MRPSKNPIQHTDKALDEYLSKELIRSFGIPTVSEALVITANEAAQAATKTGFPVVVKALGQTLLHKTERGLVRLNLTEINPEISQQTIKQNESEQAACEANYIKHVVGLMETYQKPIIGVRMAKGPGDKTLYEVDGSQYKGLNLYRGKKYDHQ